MKIFWWVMIAMNLFFAIAELFCLKHWWMILIHGAAIAMVIWILRSERELG